MAEQRRGLGRGLDSLIPGRSSETEEAPVSESSGVVSLPLDQIQSNPDQPRRYFDEQALGELAASINEIGLLQPILVRPSSSGGYQLIAGERRLRAARMAGLGVVPVVVRDEDDPDGSSLVSALIENVQREDLSPLEEATGYQALLEEHEMTHEAVATAVGKSRSAISNAIRLLQLPAPVQRMVDRGELSAGHGRALLGIDDTAYQEHLAGRVATEEWSVRRLEEAVQARNPQKAKSKRQKKETRPTEIVELESRLRDQLDTRVNINYANEKGTLQIGFASLEDLEKLYFRFFRD
ncbi:MAG: ParB/RepB/Spo0J family partition protein [Acidimicrobiia bacterium]|nr:ParB/RepB/Spo0J family partition protein [Acidimicrobiia bacterium]